MAGKATSKPKEPAAKPDDQKGQTAAPVDQVDPAAAPASTGESQGAQQPAPSGEQPAPLPAVAEVPAAPAPAAESAAPASDAVVLDPAAGESKTGAVLVGGHDLAARIAAALNAAPELQVVVEAAGEVAAEVFVERLRQIVEEGHSVEQDDTYTDYQLPRAAVCYAIRGAGLAPHKATLYWPWNPAAFKPTADDRDLIKAGALILAELQRRRRAREAS